MSDFEKLLIKEQEAARMVGVSVVTLRRDRADGRLGIPFVRLGVAVRYSPAALAAWVAARLAPTLPATTPPVTQEPKRRGRPTKAEQVAARRAAGGV